MTWVKVRVNCSGVRSQRPANVAPDSETLLGTAGTAAEGRQGSHLFILSGQSNMVGLDPEQTFAPMVKEKLGADRVIVVKEALGGAHSYFFFKGWTSAQGVKPLNDAGLVYDRVLPKIREAIGGKTIASITFIWMQGEADAARAGDGELYGRSLQGIMEQLTEDLGRKDIHLVIGRISDFGMHAPKYPDWNAVREAQVAFAEKRPDSTWVDTDDLNGPSNGLHYEPEGYRELGTRFAKAALALLARPKEPAQKKRK